MSLFKQNVRGYNFFKHHFKKSETKLSFLPHTVYKNKSHKTHAIKVQVRNLSIILKTILSYWSEVYI